MAAMLEIKNLSKRFGPVMAVDDVSFDVDRGEVLGFLGPNGAGKSTTMKMVTGFLSPNNGSMRVCGHDVLQDALAAKRCIGYLPEGAPAYPDMTPHAYLNFIADIRGLTGSRRSERLDYVIARIGLDGVMQQSIETLSKGYKRRVGLAQALLHDPDVLILDEPTDGLDPNQKHEVRGLISDMAAEKAIVISTHILEEVEAVCTRAIIIANGRIVADGTPQELEARSAYHNSVTLRLAAGAANDVRPALEAMAGIDRVETAGDGAYIVVPSGAEPIVDQVGRTAREAGWPIAELHVRPGRLDDVFREITTDKEERA